MAEYVDAKRKMYESSLKECWHFGECIMQGVNPCPHHVRVLESKSSYKQVKKSSIQRISNDFKALDALENQV